MVIKSGYLSYYLWDYSNKAYICLYVILTVSRDAHATGELVKSLLLLFVRAVFIHRWHHPPVVFFRGHVTTQLKHRGVWIFCGKDRRMLSIEAQCIFSDSERTFTFWPKTLQRKSSAQRTAIYKSKLVHWQQLLEIMKSELVRINQDKWLNTIWINSFIH